MPELSIAEQAAWTAAASVTLMTVLWLVQLRTRDAGIVDVGWAFAVGAAAAVAALTGSGDPLTRAIVGALGLLWGWRLGWHLLRDRVLGKPEDGRYAAMRTAMGRRAGAGFFAFFLLQAGFVVLFALPFMILAADSRPPGWHSALGLAIWCTGMAIEWTADRQLARWRADPANRGRTCRAGLWRWSRHPNYFGEWLLWWAYLALGLGAAHGTWLLLWPAIMLAFLRWITGIPHVERRCLATRGEDYRQYQRTTSAFIPWFPRTAP